ncbi:MAG TPA: hypothetical protein VGK25_08190 [Ignavibacteria bacterium]
MIFLSCGDDNIPVKPQGNTVIFSLDSLSVWVQPGTGFGNEFKCISADNIGKHSKS